MPLVVFEQHAQVQLLLIGDEVYDVPVWRTVTVHPDHHLSFESALYSAPASTCPPGTVLEVRGDRALVKLYRRGELVKSHFRQPNGGRATDPTRYPAHLTAYALRAPDRLVRQAALPGPSVHPFAARLLEGPLPWAKLRQVIDTRNHWLRRAAAVSPRHSSQASGAEWQDIRVPWHLVCLLTELPEARAAGSAGSGILLPSVRSRSNLGARIDGWLPCVRVQRRPPTE